MANALAPASAPAKKASRPKKPAKSADHPPYNEMIVAAIISLKERGGSSRQAIMRYIMANYEVGNEEKKINAYIKTSLKTGLTTGILKQAKGTGASGSFRLGERTAAAPKAPKTKRPAASKPKIETRQAAKSTAKRVAKATAKKSPATAKQAANSPAAKKRGQPPKISMYKSPKAAKSPAKKSTKPKANNKSPALKIAKKFAKRTAAK